MKFGTFIKQQEKRLSKKDTWRVDFLKDAVRAMKHPRFGFVEPKTWDEFRHYLWQKNACADAIKAAKYWHQKWQAYERRTQ